MTEKRGAILSTSYKDPGYANIEAGLEERYGIPKGILAALRTKGERSNADQVSEAGARTVYQIIPGTRANFLKAYGVDAYASPTAAAEVAALHIRDSHRRTRDWDAAIAEYHGGTDRRNWGKRTQAYVGRVAGTAAPARVTLENVPALPDPNTIDLMATSAGDFAWAKRALGPQPPVAAGDSKKSRRLDRALASLPTHTAIPNTPVIAAEVAAERGAVAEEGRRQGLAERGWWSRLSAAVDEGVAIPQHVGSVLANLGGGGEERCSLLIVAGAKDALERAVAIGNLIHGHARLRLGEALEELLLLAALEVRLHSLLHERPQPGGDIAGVGLRPRSNHAAAGLAAHNLGSPALTGCAGPLLEWGTVSEGKCLPRGLPPIKAGGHQPAFCPEAIKGLQAAEQALKNATTLAASGCLPS